MFFSQKQGLARIIVPMTEYKQRTVYFSSNCPEGLCEGIGQPLRKDDSCDSTLAIYNEFFIYGENTRIRDIEEG